MPTLLMRLAGPIQSWGVQSRFELRDTGTVPSKSGVIGIVCAALGRDRAEPIDDVARLRMGVRVDREGQIRRDFQTIRGWSWDRKAKRWTPNVHGTISNRYFLADALFLVGLEGESRGQLEAIDQALTVPRWPLVLGRRANTPSQPIHLKHSILDLSLEQALAEYPWLGGSSASADDGEEDESLRTVIEVGGEVSDGLLRQRVPDQPLSFAPRRFALREVVVSHVSRPRHLEESDVPEQA